MILGDSLQSLVGTNYYLSPPAHENTEANGLVLDDRIMCFVVVWQEGIGGFKDILFPIGEDWCHFTGWHCLAWCSAGLPCSSSIFGNRQDRTSAYYFQYSFITTPPPDYLKGCSDSFIPHRSMECETIHRKKEGHEQMYCFLPLYRSVTTRRATGKPLRPAPQKETFV